MFDEESFRGRGQQEQIANTLGACMIFRVFQQRRAFSGAAPPGRNHQRAQQCDIAEELESDEPGGLTRRSGVEEMLAVRVGEIGGRQPRRLQ
jgi:hypothetical protein